MLNSDLVNISVVVTASDHNPTILNPDFLDRTGIVPSEWGWSPSESPITTPPFASVKYDSGVSITVESNKLQITGVKEKSPTDTKIADIAVAYMRTLQYVQYKAIGVNFDCVLSQNDVVTFLKNRFLKDDFSSDDQLESLGLKLVYATEAADRFTLTLDPAKKVGGEEDKPQEVIIAKGNFHKDISAYSDIEEAVNTFPVVRNCWDFYIGSLEKILG